MSTQLHTIDLPALDGANPLGFLAALGTLATAIDAGENQARLGWRKGAVWRPFLSGLREPDALCGNLCAVLRGKAVAADAESARAAAKKDFEAAAGRLKKLREAFKQRGLRGNARDEAYKSDVAPMEEEVRARRAVFLEKLSAAVPHPELSIGKKVDLSAEEFRSKAKAFLHDTDSRTSGAVMLAGLATESCNEKQCPRTYFDFIDSSGQLAFLEAALQLMSRATPQKLEATLFHPWLRSDEKYSLRFDPVEDRRYALLDRDPTAGNNKSSSEWMANLLAYRSLAMFPCAIVRRKSHTAGWMEEEHTAAFTWPIWDNSLPPDTIRSLLSHAELTKLKPALSLKHQGVQAAYRARRIANGDYVNFSPAAAVL